MPKYLISYRKTEGTGQIDDVLYRREEAAPETSIVYGLCEE